MEPYIWTGGLYKHEEMEELVEDMGGYVLQKNILQTDVIMIILVPDADIPVIEAKNRELLGKLTKAPLAGAEVAVVTPTLAYQHLPHLACDIAEYLRRAGSKTNMIGLARGVGRRVAQLTAREIDLVNEHDAAVFLYGNFKDCIREKAKLFRDIEVPIVVTGGPQRMDVAEIPGCRAYIGGLGRMMHRLRQKDETASMDRIVDAIGEVLDQQRREFDKDPLSVSPPRLKAEIEKQVPDIQDSISPTPVTLNLNGARVKLPYDDYSEAILGIRFDEGVYMREVAMVSRSKMKNYILLRIKPKSETGFVI